MNKRLKKIISHEFGIESDSEDETTLTETIVSGSEDSDSDFGSEKQVRTPRKKGDLLEQSTGVSKEERKRVLFALQLEVQFLRELKRKDRKPPQDEEDENDPQANILRDLRRELIDEQFSEMLYKNEIKLIQQAFQSIEQSIHEMDKAFRSKKKEYTQLSKQYKSLRSSFNELKARNKKIITAVENRLITLIHELDWRAEYVVQLKSSKTRLSSICRESLQESKKLKWETLQMKEKFLSLQKDLQTIQGIWNEKNEKMKRYKETFLSLIQQYEEEKEEILKIKSENEKVFQGKKEELEKQTEIVNQTISYKKKTENEYFEVQNIFNELQSQYEQAEITLKENEKKINSLLKTVESLPEDKDQN
ncbi:structural maintenance of chromosomes protein [Anaeramoeba flamelloides]|uniref:Structural maintenance of chromosomes protein n=1 Tax=Anaeramoeba flamelloides TaxID=1746091 RepID=A0ABQ8YP33_9EUKA|nr:structural maintenance of chromosomes protein [Anaeramoeba flamelloides]